MLDTQVIVIGGGPGGSSAAKKCAEQGLKTLLIEKKKLPREKICAAMLFMDVTVRQIEQEFGQIPSNAFADPAYFYGESVVHGIEPEIRIKTVGGKKTPSILRSNFDYWLNQKARDKGVEIYDGTKVVSVMEENDGCIVEMEKEGNREKIKSSFIIGADGANSIVRSYLYPYIKPRFTQGYQEWYEGDIEPLYNLDRKVTHGFIVVIEGVRGMSIPPTALYQKGTHFVLDVDIKIGEAKKAIAEGKRVIKNCGIDLPEPARKGAALIPSLHKELLSGSFVPARGNILLVGDAGGLLVPITGEGIGTAMMSGFSAAAAVVRAAESGGKAAKYYLENIDDMLSKFKQIYSLAPKFREQATKGIEEYMSVFDEVWALTDILF
jgi:flavin-dependent dehydrogenase